MESRPSGCWLLSRESDGARVLAREFTLPGDSVLVLKTGADLPEVGVFATPTRVAVNQLTVFDLQIPQDPVLPSEADSLCVSIR